MITILNAKLEWVSQVDTIKLNGEEIVRRDFVLSWVEQDYPRSIVLTGWREKAIQYASLVGKRVSFSFYPAAHEYNGKWYNRLTLWDMYEYSERPMEDADAALKAPVADFNDRPPF